MTTRLEDLPAFEIAHVEAADHPRLHGVFTHLRSVKAGRSWLYHPADPLIGDSRRSGGDPHRAEWLGP